MKYTIDIHESKEKWVLVVNMIKYTESILTTMSFPVSFQVFDTKEQAKIAKESLKHIINEL